MEMEEKATHVYLKIAKVMGEIGKITQDHNGRYQSHTIDAVASKLNPVMAEHKLLIIPSVREVDKSDPIRHTIYYDMNVIDAESGELITYQWIAEAMLRNEDNKPYGNAHSYAMKYFCLRLFMISAADDPDVDARHNTGQKTAQKSSKKGNSGTKKAVHQVGQKGGQKHWTDNQFNVDFVKKQGKMLKDKFGAEIVNEIKATIKTGDHDTAQKYIDAIRGGCEAAKKVADELKTNVINGPFGKSVEKIISPKSSEGETSILKSLMWDKTPSQRDFWQACFVKGNSETFITIYGEDIDLIEYCTELSIHGEHEEIVFDEDIYVVLKPHSTKKFKILSVYDGDDFIDERTKRQLLNEMMLAGVGD